jgi:hypothetical protein
MHYKIIGWYDVDAGHYVVRVITLTAPVIEHPEMDAVYRRAIEEWMPNELGTDPDPESFTRLDLAEDDETIPEAERGYTYYEMHS